MNGHLSLLVVAFISAQKIIEIFFAIENQQKTYGISQSRYTEQHNAVNGFYFWETLMIWIQSLFLRITFVSSKQLHANLFRVSRFENVWSSFWIKNEPLCYCSFHLCSKDNETFFAIENQQNTYSISQSRYTEQHNAVNGFYIWELLE